MSEVVRRTYKFRLYPNRSQTVALEAHLTEAARLYNAAVQERRDAWRMCRKRVTYFDQNRQIKDIRATGDIGIANAKAAMLVLRRVNLAFQAFFRRVQAGESPGYPRFRSPRRYDSLDFQRGDGVHIKGNRLSLQGIGDVKAKWHRPITGRPKVYTIKRQAGRWFACVTVETSPERLPENELSVGIDVGLTTLATLSDGTTIENSRHAARSARRLRRLQRRASRALQGSHRRRKAAAVVARLHWTIANQRADAHHKASRAIVDRYGLIAVEDLNIKGLSRTRMAKSVHDAAWRSLLNKIAYKAEGAGRQFVQVDARGTSQACLCGCEVRKTLKVRWHECPECGLSAPRDLVSAQLIERLGRSRQALSPAGAELA